MTTPEISKTISQGEGISIEFKEAREKVPASFYETVVSFANTVGGTILLGVDDDGNVTGINPEKKADYLKNIATALKSTDKINPPLFVNSTAIEYEGKIIIAVQIPASSLVHDHTGRIYIRENEVDIDVTGNQHEIRGLFLKKSDIYTENTIYQGLKMSDFDEILFEKARKYIRINDKDHPWLSIDNMQILREASLFQNDYKQNKEGFTLAAALLFAKDTVIQSILPAYKIEAMVRIHNKDRYDDRITLRTNLIDSYLKLNEFIKKHLPDKFFLEGFQRIDLRDRIFREVVGNIIVHREYTNGTASELLIEEDAVRTVNPNNPRVHGIMDLENFNPHPKNPNIRRFFNALGWADEIGSGIRNTKKYLPFYVENAKPVFIDKSLFRTVIPLIRYTMSDFVNKWHNWLELDEKWLPKLTESLKNIEIDGRLQKMSWEEQLEYLVPSWIEKAPSSTQKSAKSKNYDGVDNQKDIENNSPSHDEKSAKSDEENRPSPNEKATKLYGEKGTSRDEKGDKLERLYNAEYQQYNYNLGTSTNEKGHKSDEENRPSSNEKPTKFNKKMQYIIVILFMLGSPLSIDELMEIFEYRHKDTFRQNYIKPLVSIGLITKTNPEKPTASNQKYIITEKGKRFLTGQNFKI